MIRRGFTLIELMASLALSGIILTTLYNSFFLTTRSVDVAEPFIENDLRSTLIHNQIIKDVEGVFIPVQAELKKSSTMQQASPDQKQEKPTDKIFYSIDKDGSLSVLSFITNNPLHLYYDEKSGPPHPAVVRVVYRATSDKEKGFTLTRQESANLDFDAFDLKASKPIRGYELANNIKNISMEYAFGQQEEQKKGSSSDKAQKDQPVTFKTEKEWRFEEWKKKDPNTKVPRVPQFVTMKLTLWDAKRLKESEFVFKIEMPTFVFLTEQRTTATSATQTPPAPVSDAAKTNSTQTVTPAAPAPGTKIGQ